MFIKDVRLKHFHSLSQFHVKMVETTASKSDKRLKTAEIKVQKILNKIQCLKLNDLYKSRLDLKRSNLNIWRLHERKKTFLCFLGIIVTVYCVYYFYSNFSSPACILTLPPSLKSLFRRPEDCSMCVGVHDVARVANITPREFEDNFAYTTAPVIVVDATNEWKAIKEFNFKFFADFYINGKMGTQINDCFYFAYKSGLNSLKEVFDMDERRANLSGEPWYVGWSTCYDEEIRQLRTYYNRPYFLPKTAESDMLDWIFMGGPGQGAHMHVDSVGLMSWQAQIRGRKQWQLAPPPECLYRCSWITFTVEPGEILVVDTNRWYHRTSVLPGDISITIGAEYD